MHVGSNPTARTSQFQSPRSPYRRAGRLFSIRFADSIASCWCPIICVFPFPCLLAYLITICGFPSHISPLLSLFPYPLNLLLAFLLASLSAERLGVFILLCI